MILFNIAVFLKNIYVISALEKRKLKQCAERIISITRRILENIYMIKIILCMCPIRVPLGKGQVLRFVIIRKSVRNK